MPRAKRACPAPGCPNVRGECERHRPEPWAARGDTRPETGSGAWRTTRARVLRSAGHRCYLCGEQATEVDHRLAKCLGGDDHPDNLAAICTPCHRRKTAAEATEARRRHRAARSVH